MPVRHREAVADLVDIPTRNLRDHGVGAWSVRRRDINTVGRNEARRRVGDSELQVAVAVDQQSMSWPKGLSLSVTRRRPRGDLMRLG